MKNCEFEELISAYIDGELDDNESEKMRAHLSECETCRESYEAFKKIKFEIENADIELPKELHSTIMNGLGFKNDEIGEANDISKTTEKKPSKIIRLFSTKIGALSFAGVAAVICLTMIASPLFKRSMALNNDSARELSMPEEADMLNFKEVTDPGEELYSKSYIVKDDQVACESEADAIRSSDVGDGEGVEFSSDKAETLSDGWGYRESKTLEYTPSYDASESANAPESVVGECTPSNIYYVATEDNGIYSNAIDHFYCGLNSLAKNNITLNYTLLTNALEFCDYEQERDTLN